MSITRTSRSSPLALEEEEEEAEEVQSTSKRS